MEKKVRCNVKARCDTMDNKILWLISFAVTICTRQITEFANCERFAGGYEQKLETNVFFPRKRSVG